MEKRTLGDIVSAYLLDHNMTQQELADNSHLSVGIISELKRNIIVPTMRRLSTIHKLREGMGIPKGTPEATKLRNAAGYFFGNEDNPLPVDPARTLRLIKSTLGDLNRLVGRLEAELANNN